MTLSEEGRESDLVQLTPSEQVAMLFALRETGADSLIVGAYAVAAHGHPRATGDLDVWIRPSPENAERVFQSLKVLVPLFTLLKKIFTYQTQCSRLATGRSKDHADLDFLKNL